MNDQAPEQTLNCYHEVVRIERLHFTIAATEGATDEAKLEEVLNTSEEDYTPGEVLYHLMNTIAIEISPKRQLNILLEKNGGGLINGES